MAAPKSPKNRPTTTAERVAFLGVCAVACIALIAVTLWDCRRQPTLPETQNAAPANEVIVPVRVDSVHKKTRPKTKRRHATKDSTHHRSRRKAAPKRPASRPTPATRDYTRTPQQEE